MTPIAALARHHVRPEEAEQAILDLRAILVEIEGDGGEDRLKAVGTTASGRVLAVVFTLRDQVIRPITAYAAPAPLEALFSSKGPYDRKAKSSEVSV